MKTIIVPTDFSPAAINAANYAADMAIAINASLTLLNVYQIPVAVTDNPTPLTDLDELKQFAEQRLRKHKSDLAHITSGTVSIDAVAILGNMSDELEELCTTLQPFAIVMGTTGHSSLERTLFGSNTLSVINHITWPVICVPMGKEYGTGIKKIGLACDFREVAATTPVSLIRDFVHSFRAELHILNVQKEQPAANVEQQSSFLKAALADTQPAFHFVHHNDIEDGINEFAETNNLDLIITIPKKHRLLHNLFRKNSTRRLVFESHIPVMCLHE